MFSYVFLFSLRLTNSPMSEDALYYWSIKHFIDTGVVQFHPLIAPTFFLQFFYGLAFVKLFGLGFAVLQAATILVAGATVPLFYIFLRRFFSSTQALAGALVLLSNPIFVYLSHSFLTDIYALFFILAAALFGHRAIATRSDRDLLICSVFSIAGFYVRQWALAIVGGVFLYYLLQRRRELNIRKIAIMLVIPLLAVTPWLYWAQAHSLVRLQYHLPQLGLNIAGNLLRPLYFLSLMFLPFSLVFLYNMRAKWKRVASARIAGFVAVALLAVWYAQRIVAGKGLWFGVNILNQQGLGQIMVLHPVAVKDLVTIHASLKAALFPGALWIPVVALSFVALFFLAVSVYTERKNSEMSPLLFMAAAYALAVIPSALTIDRYFLVMMALLVPFVLKRAVTLKHWRPLMGVAVVLMAFWGWVGTYDYQSWNEAKWDVARELINSGVDPKVIEFYGELGLLYDSCMDGHGVCSYRVTLNPNDGTVVASKDYLQPWGNIGNRIYGVKLPPA